MALTGDDQGLDWGDVDAEAEAVTDYLTSVTGFDAIREHNRRSHARLRLAPGDRVLDVGCGIGQDVVALADDVGPEGDVVGVDRSASLIATAADRAAAKPAASFQVADALQLPFEDGTFDGCWADRVFQHLPDPAGALYEMQRVTRPGGRITVSDPD